VRIEDHGPWVCRLVTPPRLTPELQIVKDAAEALLCARDVWDIDSYDMDPDYTGYVMWVQQPPYDHEVSAWQANVPPTRSPTAQEQVLMELGHDFFGLMKTARHCIGQGSSLSQVGRYSLRNA